MIVNKQIMYFALILIIFLVFTAVIIISVEIKVYIRSWSDYSTFSIYILYIKF